MSQSDCNTQRQLGYRAVIPFYILWDNELNANHLRLYGQIEQMESNPNPNVNATFSYQWIADVLGINRRNAIKVANTLKKKKYIKRTKISATEYIWNTVKKGVIECSDDEEVVSPRDTRLVSLGDTQNTHKLKSKEKIYKKEKSPSSTYQETLYQPISTEVLTYEQQLSDESFALFFQVYPVKKSENRARVAWYSQRCYEKFEEIMTSLNNLITHDSAFKDGYAPNPDKWIFEERWKDKPVKRTKNKKSSASDDLDMDSLEWTKNKGEYL